MLSGLPKMETLHTTDPSMSLGKRQTRLVQGKEVLSEHPLMGLEQVTVAGHVGNSSPGTWSSSVMSRGFRSLDGDFTSPRCGLSSAHTELLGPSAWIAATIDAAPAMIIPSGSKSRQSARS